MNGERQGFDALLDVDRPGLTEQELEVKPVFDL